jgi:CIC family chloride channel protein
MLRRPLTQWWDVIYARAPGNQSWLVPLAVVIGFASGYAALGFYWLLTLFSWLFLGAHNEHDLLDAVSNLVWWQVVLAPTVGGLCVGIALTCLSPEKRTATIVDVMGAALSRGPKSLISFRSAIGSGLATTLSLGSGASAGREGPVVHLCAGIASLVVSAVRSTGMAELTGRDIRTLLGAAAAAAVSASFNAPIAGILFAHEVILRHYSVSAMAPITIAAVAGAVVARTHADILPAFDVPAYSLVSYFELPAFALLGLIAGVVSIVFVLAIKNGNELASRIPLPLWLRPVIGGLAIGVLALWMPEIMSVGYGAVDNTLHERYGWQMLAWLVIAKMAATTITLASRFGGGIFSPSLYLGAVTGGLFGLAIQPIFPDLTSSYGAYAMVGMGAVAAAVLRAPISTTLIVFEMTGDYNMTIALLVSSSIATISNQAALRESLFEWQLLGRDIDVRKGTYKTVLQTIYVSDFMQHLDTPYDLTDPNTPVVHPEMALDAALRMLEDSGEDSLPVVETETSSCVIGLITYKEALKAFNDGLIDTNVEEHL